MNRTITVEIAPGELIDKITILEIKLARIADAAKLRNVRAEWETLVRARDAAHRFASALAAEALLDQTARLEATLAADGLEALFALEQALDLAWPRRTPSCELIWATETAAEVLRLRAFDDAGRLLLVRAYSLKGAKHA